MQVKIISSTGLIFEIKVTQVESKPGCEYLGVYVDFKVSWNTHINVFLKILGKQ